MARPIRETPILTGPDAERFVAEMQKTESLSRETRAANLRKLMADFAAVRERIDIRL